MFHAGNDVFSRFKCVIFILVFSFLVIIMGSSFLHQVAEEEERPNQSGQVITEETPDRHGNS